ncbi:MAG TPA: PrgI family protein [Candidatus Saccharimonadales bacterium]|nr:PrgI family protein [Candidatus Saccharimonadales bacterium]
MAVYKVPQDVEAEDKLVGPFGFRQFVYLGIAAGTGFIGYLLFQIQPVLLVIPIPIIIFFVVLALPLRKEQPMETYLLALLRFYLKPKLRLWNPDGTITYVEIVAPKLVEQKLTKDLVGETATERLDYLARIMDSRGWSLKGQTAPGASLTAEVAAEAQTATDVLDEDAALAQSFATKIAQKDQERREQVMTQMRQAAKAPPAPVQRPAQPVAPPPARAAAPDDTSMPTDLHYNPYPSSMHQRVILPMGDQPAPQAQPAAAAQQNPAEPPASAMPQTVSPDIIRLANNDDLSISAIAHEAHRLAEQSGEEVVIKLH